MKLLLSAMLALPLSATIDVASFFQKLNNPRTIAATKAICGGCAAVFFTVNACLRATKALLRTKYHPVVKYRDNLDGSRTETDRWHKNEGYRDFNAVDPHALLYNGLPAAACVFCAIKSLEFTITQAQQAYTYKTFNGTERLP